MNNQRRFLLNGLRVKEWIIPENIKKSCWVKVSCYTLCKKIEEMLSNTLRMKFSYFKIIHIFNPCYSRVFIHKITRLIIMKMNMKNRLHRCKINRPRSKHGYICSKFKKSLGIKCQFYKMVKRHSCLIMFGHFVGLALKGLSNT